MKSLRTSCKPSAKEGASESRANLGAILPGTNRGVDGRKHELAHAPGDCIDFGSPTTQRRLIGIDTAESCPDITVAGGETAGNDFQRAPAGDRRAREQAWRSGFATGVGPTSGPKHIAAKGGRRRYKGDQQSKGDQCGFHAEVLFRAKGIGHGSTGAIVIGTDRV
jgi:hypothetical protein